MSALDTSAHTSSDLTGSYAYTDLKQVYYGPGIVETALPTLLEKIGAKKALIVTGKSLHDKTDVIKQIEAILRKHDAYGGVFYEIGEHAPIAGLKNGLNKLKEVGADTIVAVGGGSPIDASKAILYNLQQETGGEFRKQIAIPTTLSAAEYTVGAGFTNEQGVKVAVSAQELAPAGIILDAKLTLATPERLWLSTGIRALDHAVEGLYRPLVPPPLKHLFYASIADLFKYLPQSKANPQDVEVRQKLQIAAWMSLWPIKPPRYVALGLSHALGHKLGAAYGIPHGITSCMTLAPVIAIQATATSVEDRKWLADTIFYLRIPSQGTEEKDISALSEAIFKLVADLGLHSTLTQYNVPRDDVPKIAEKALGGVDNPLFPKIIQLLENLY